MAKREKLGCWGKKVLPYCDAQGEVTNALRQLHPGIGGIAACARLWTSVPHTDFIGRRCEKTVLYVLIEMQNGRSYGFGYC
jgi:hypothetical protein